MNACIKSFQYGRHQLTIETGVIARQATGAVMVDMDGTTVLVTVVGVKTAAKGQDFFPLTVHYQERMYAAGKIPGGFIKREGRPSENETLVSRLIDRPIRPLFPEGFMNEVQIIATVMSHNPDVNPDIPALIGASAALAISGIPFEGPVGAARVGYIDGEFVLNPSQKELDRSQLDLVVAGTETSILMVESEAQLLSEETMLEAVMFGHRHMNVAIEAIKAIQAEAGKPRWEWAPQPENLDLIQGLRDRFEAKIASAYNISEKASRQDAIRALREEAVAQFMSPADVVGPVISDRDVLSTFESLESKIVRTRILDGELRIDGRDTETVRPISTAVGLLPRTHGSALFTRGETQAIVVATIGSGRDAQILDQVSGESKDHFMLHYNFPPYCVGETGMVGSPKRREIGHGRLAKRGVQSVLPDENEFPYVIRVVSEITESNGSSSMASVCGSSLALMDAGVPIKAPVAGIAMGLVKEGDRFAVLTDILGDEDHLGDMDFKVAGTETGVTALQMDIKINGITRDIMQVALQQAKAGRLHILNVMKQTISTPRTELSPHAPRMIHFMINPDKIRDVIGKGGATIRKLTETSGASIEISDEGRVSIVATDGEAAQYVQDQIKALTTDISIGQIYKGPVTRIADFGIFVGLQPGKDGLVHISQIAEERVENLSERYNVGDVVTVKVLDIDRQGRIKLSIKALQVVDAANTVESAETTTVSSVGEEE